MRTRGPPRVPKAGPTRPPCPRELRPQIYNGIQICWYSDPRRLRGPQAAAQPPGRKQGGPRSPESISRKDPGAQAQAVETCTEKEHV